jgi:UDP-3-O-[3-hydroxymyristoyl] glucosamine N-acyltransferase
MDHIIKADTVAKFINAELIGENIDVVAVSSLDNLGTGSLSFINKSLFAEDVTAGALLLVKKDKSIESVSLNSYIRVPNPRLAFAKIVQKFFLVNKMAGISDNARIGKNASFGENVTIGENCVVGDNVCVGDNTVINNCVIINSNTVIGANCYIKSGSIIGEDGFGFDFEEDGTPVRIPHMGRVIISNNVEIGAGCTIARGTLKDTFIGSYVKVDDQVHIAHNCCIGKNTIITAQAELSGSVIVGEGCWVGPNCSIIQKVRIGNNVKIGIGAIITSDVENNKTMMGLESLAIKELVKLKRRIGLP